MVKKNIINQNKYFFLGKINKSIIILKLNIPFSTIIFIPSFFIKKEK